MNTQHLRYALEIEKTGSISRAAANLYMSQPNLSKALRELEASLGLTIFRRSSKGVQPTPKGREFLVHARAVMDQVEAMEALSRPDRSLLGFHVCVPPCSYLAQAFARFVQQLDRGKPLDISFRETSSATVLSRVEGGLCRIGVIRCDVAEQAAVERRLAAAGLESRPLWRFRQRLLLYSAHPLARKERISAEDLAPYTCLYDEDLLHPEAGFAPEEVRENGSRILVFDRESQYRLLQRLPECYMWTTPVPRRLLDDYQLLQRACPEAAPHCQDLLVYSQGYCLNALDEAFLGEVLSVKEEIAAAL